MKVLMIEHFSAGNEYSLELCKNLSDYVDLTLLTVDNSKLKGSREYIYKKVLCGYGHAPLKRITKYIRGLFATVREIISGDYDIIHIQTFRIAYVEIVVYLMLKTLGRKFVHTVHNVLPHEAKWSDRFFYYMMYKISDALIVHNEATAVMLRRRFKSTSKKIRIIPHGTYDFYKSFVVDEKRPAGDVVRFLQMGKIRDYKGADILIRAAGVVAAKYRGKFKVVIAGKRECGLDFEYLIKEQGVEDTVEMMSGFIPSEEIAKLFKMSDACVFPYKNVYGSGALLLSYTFGNPVIVSDIPTFIEETDDGAAGLIFKSEDYHDLAQKMIDFIEMDEEQRSRYRENIKELVDKKYNWKNSALLTSRIYNSL